jgi:hypothetical protein
VSTLTIRNLVQLASDSNKRNVALCLLIIKTYAVGKCIWWLDAWKTQGKCKMCGEVVWEEGRHGSGAVTVMLSSM